MPNWLEYNGMCYFFSTIVKTFKYAKNYCQSLGASLLRLEKDKSDFIFHTVIIKFA